MCLSLIQPPILHQLNKPLLGRYVVNSHQVFFQSCLFGTVFLRVCDLFPPDAQLTPAISLRHHPGVLSPLFSASCDFLFLGLCSLALSLSLSVSVEYVERFWYLMKKVCVMFLCELKN